MTEVDKLYSLAGVKKIYIECPADYYGYKCGKSNWDDADCLCDQEVYPPFTAEKQIEIIKVLAEGMNLVIHHSKRTWIIERERCDYYSSKEVKDRTFENALAKLVQSIWQDLTEAEQNEIKNILKG